MRHWCVVVRPAETASAGEVSSLALAFEAEGSRVDSRREGLDVLVFAADRLALREVEAAVMEVLNRHGLVDAVVMPPLIGRWDETLGRYLVVADTRAPIAPAISGDEITWAVAVRPASAFDWRGARGSHKAGPDDGTGDRGSD